MVDLQWSWFSENCEQSWFVMEDSQWSMVDVRASARFVGDFWFTEKNGRLSGFRKIGRKVWFAREIIDSRSSIERRLMVQNASNLRSTMQIALRKNCGHNWRKLIHIEMKVMCFFCIEEIYKNFHR
jgi:hypothetical protein